MTDDAPERRPPPFGLQVALGFLIPVIALGVTCVGLTITGGVTGNWSSAGVLLSGGAGFLVFIAGIAMGSARGWKGVILGLVLFGALLALLLGSCFLFLLKPAR